MQRVTSRSCGWTAFTESMLKKLVLPTHSSVIGDEVVTARLDGTILPGITRNSVIAILKKKGIKVAERKTTIDEIVQAYKDGKFKEMFASGTAAVISPVGELRYKDEDMIINNGEIGPIAQELYDTIYGTRQASCRMTWAGQ